MSAYTVYGQPLPAGYCESHPDVPQEWPCELCQNAALEHAEALADYDGKEPPTELSPEIEAVAIGWALMVEDRRHDITDEEVADAESNSEAGS